MSSCDDAAVYMYIYIYIHYTYTYTDVDICRYILIRYREICVDICRSCEGPMYKLRDV